MFGSARKTHDISTRNIHNIERKQQSMSKDHAICRKHTFLDRCVEKGAALNGATVEENQKRICSVRDAFSSAHHKDKLNEILTMPSFTEHADSCLLEQIRTPTRQCPTTHQLGIKDPAKDRPQEMAILIQRRGFAKWAERRKTGGESVLWLLPTGPRTPLVVPETSSSLHAKDQMTPLTFKQFYILLLFPFQNESHSVVEEPLIVHHGVWRPQWLCCRSHAQIQMFHVPELEIPTNSSSCFSTHPGQCAFCGKPSNLQTA